jgi:hypothetical protein
MINIPFLAHFLEFLSGFIVHQIVNLQKRKDKGGFLLILLHIVQLLCPDNALLQMG